MLRGGRGVYVGGVQEFEQYAAHYHSITPHTSPSLEGEIGELRWTHVCIQTLYMSTPHCSEGERAGTGDAPAGGEVAAKTPSTASHSHSSCLLSCLPPAVQVSLRSPSLL